jgi:outer membrane protein OmpA-like peptidoglycan-associated protein
MNRIGKCSNLAGCLRAYRGEEITISEGEFVCPECGQPLKPLGEEVKEMSRGSKMGASIGIGVILAVVIGVIVFVGRPTPKPKPAKEQPAEEIPVRRAERAGDTSQPAQPAVTPEPAEVRPATAVQPEPEVRRAIAVQAEAAPNLDLASDANRTVKAEVLKRIDLMPTISADNKDKLYMSVERARQMGRLLTIPFNSGRTTLAAADMENLRAATRQPQIEKLMSDPTAVFVILGFADTKGDEKKNIAISEQRADSVLNALKSKCGVINVLHSVGMGGSTLFDPAGTEKNRVAEVWVVLP